MTAAAIKAASFALSTFSSYVALLYKLGQLRRSWRDVVYLTLMTTLLLQCLTFSMGAMALASDTLFGVKNLPILLMHLAAVAFCVSAQILLLQWSSPLAQVRRTLVYWLVAGVGLDGMLVALFLLADAQHVSADQLATGSSNPVILVYLLIFIVSQAIPCVTIFRQCIPYARMTTNPWLRRALRLLAAGSTLLFFYCTARTVNIVTPLFGIDVGGWSALAAVFSGLGMFIVSVGLTMPSWGRHLDSVVQWAGNYASYRALYPLWNALYQSSPSIALEPPSSSISDLRYRLHRRVIEIRDGWRALRPYMDQADPDALTRLPETPAGEEARQAIIEAAKIKQALRAKEAGQPPPNDRDDGRIGAWDPSTFAAEVSWLRRVSSAFARLS